MSISRLDAIHREIKCLYEPMLRSRECMNYAMEFEHKLTGRSHTDADGLTLTNLVENIASGGVYNIRVDVSSDTYHWMIVTLKDADTVRIYHKWGCGIPTIMDVTLGAFTDYITAYNDLNQLMHGKTEQLRGRTEQFCRDAAHNIIYDTIDELRTNRRFERKTAENVSIGSLAPITALLGRITAFEDAVYNHSYKETYHEPERGRDSEVESDDGVDELTREMRKLARKIEELTHNMELLSLYGNRDEAIEALKRFLHALAGRKAGVWLLIPAPAPPAGGRRKTRNKRRNRNKRTRRNYRRH